LRRNKIFFQLLNLWIIESLCQFYQSAENQTFFCKSLIIFYYHFCYHLIYKMIEALRCKTCIVVLVHVFIGEDTLPVYSSNFPGFCLRKDLSTPLSRRETFFVGQSRIMLPNDTMQRVTLIHDRKRAKSRKCFRSAQRNVCIELEICGMVKRIGQTKFPTNH